MPASQPTGTVLAMLQQPWLPSSLPRCRLESRLLGNVRYFNDLIVTHSDQDYMARWAGGVGCS